MESPDRLVRISVFVPADLLGRIREAADRQGVPSAVIIRAALAAGVGARRPLPIGGFLREHPILTMKE